MKKIRILFSLLTCLFVMTGCHNDTPSYNDTDYLDKLTRGIESVCYVLDDMELYYSASEGNSEWEKVDLNEIVGWSPVGPSRLLVHDGKTWSPLELFNLSHGWHPLYYPLAAYRINTGSKVDFFITRPFSYDKATNKLTLAKTYCGMDLTTTFDVEYADDNGMVLVYYEGRVPENARRKEVLKYKKSTIDISELANSPFYESEKAAKLDIIRILKEEFGNPFNINPYFKGDIIFPNPMVNLDRIEELVNEGKDWEGKYYNDIFMPEN